MWKRHWFIVLDIQGMVSWWSDHWTRPREGALRAGEGRDGAPPGRGRLDILQTERWKSQCGESWFPRKMRAGSLRINDGRRCSRFSDSFGLSVLHCSYSTKTQQSLSTFNTRMNLKGAKQEQLSVADQIGDQIDHVYQCVLQGQTKFLGNVV